MVSKIVEDGNRKRNKKKRKKSKKSKLKRRRSKREDTSESEDSFDEDFKDAVLDTNLDTVADRQLKELADMQKQLNDLQKPIEDDPDCNDGEGLEDEEENRDGRLPASNQEAQLTKVCMCLSIYIILCCTLPFYV